MSSGPKRSESRRAIGRAPMVKMSRRIPPTPVAAPWNGSMKDGWLWDSILKTMTWPSPMSMIPAFSPGPWTTFLARGRELLEVDLGALVAAVLGPHGREDAELGQVGLAADEADDEVVFVRGDVVLGEDCRREVRFMGHIPAEDGFEDDQAVRRCRGSAPTARSGWGIIPMTLPRLLIRPAIAWSEPLTLDSSVSRPSASQ